VDSENTGNVKNTKESTIQGSGSHGDSLIDFFNPDGIPYAVGLILAAVILIKLINRMANRISERIVHQRLLIKKINTFVAFGAYVVTFVLASSSLFNFSSQALFALSGTLAVTAGFALKDVAASFLAGISILINKPFQVGDRIHFGGFYGEVKEIGLRTVQMVTLEDNLVTIPSNKFLTESVASANAGELDCMVVVKFYINSQSDHKRAKEIVHDAILASKYLYLGKPYAVLVSTELTEEGKVMICFTSKAYVYDTRHEKAFASDITERVLGSFKHNRIII